MTLERRTPCLALAPGDAKLELTVSGLANMLLWPDETADVEDYGASMALE